MFKGESGSSGTFKRIGTIADNIVPPPPGTGPTTMTYQWRVGDLIASQSGMTLEKAEEKGAVKESGTDEVYWIRIEIPGQDDGFEVVPQSYASDPIVLRFVDPKGFKKTTMEPAAAPANQGIK